MLLCLYYVLLSTIKKAGEFLLQLFSFLGRCLADSNRRRRFCRPLTKPLIQGTVFQNAGAKVAIFLDTAKFFLFFFASDCIFLLKHSLYRPHSHQ